MRKKGIITAAAHSHKVVLSDTEFHCEDQAQKCHHILHCQVWVLSRICHCFPDAPYFSQSLETLGNYKRLSFHLQETKWKQSPEKELYLWIWSLKSVQSALNQKANENNKNAFSFLGFWYSHSLRGCSSFLGAESGFLSTCGHQPCTSGVKSAGWGKVLTSVQGKLLQETLPDCVRALWQSWGGNPGLNYPAF